MSGGGKMVFIVWYVGGLFLLTLFLTVGGFILQRDRYWRRIWEKLGKPNVDSIKELKELYKLAELNHKSNR